MAIHCHRLVTIVKQVYARFMGVQQHISPLRYVPRRVNQIIKNLVVVTILAFIAMGIWESNQRTERLNSSSQIARFLGAPRRLHDEKGKRRDRKKYLSYQPPGGGWNNQRIAFENAAIIAFLLGRTLLVQPLAPHDRMLQFMVRYNISAGYTIYNMLRAEELVPISKLINFKRLSSLLSVQEITSNHNDFVKEYANMSWYKVCHNGLVYTWIDKIPVECNKSSLFFEYYSKNSKAMRKQETISKYRQMCLDKTENDIGIWEFLDELRKRKEEFIYFEKGSLFVRDMYFTDYKRALLAQKLIIDYIQPTQDILYTVEKIIHTIKMPFNAIHVRRNNHKTGKSLDIQYWISRLAKAHALRYSDRLYIATDETNQTWFFPLKEAGYSILYAKDFQIFRAIHQNYPVTGKDIIGFHEQVICSRAKIFIGSYYSTFSRLIERYREAQYWNRKHFRNFIFSSVKWLNLKIDR